VGGTALSTFHWWKKDPKKIGTAFIVDVDGIVYRIFEPQYWANHLGIKSEEAEQTSIGIELASVGPLMKSDGKFYCFERITPQTEYTGKVFDVGAGKRWRGYRFFAQYTDQQIRSTSELVEMLFHDFNIKAAAPIEKFNVLSKMPQSGVFGHFHVRSDKSDVHPGFDWKSLNVKLS
jgi:N-acetyl-anhydromuramyl-L-alanine amidase AmpD